MLTKIGLNRIRKSIRLMADPGDPELNAILIAALVALKALVEKRFPE